MTLLTISQAAEKLTVCDGMVYKLIRTQALGAYKVGTAYRVSEEDIDEYLKRRYLKAKVPKGLCTTPNTLNPNK